VRRGLVPRDIAAAVRAIRDEQTVAVRAVMQRWSAAKRTATEKRQAKLARLTHWTPKGEPGRPPDPPNAKPRPS